MFVAGLDANIGNPILFIGDNKKPAHWRVLLSVAVLAPADPDGAIIQMFNPYSDCVADVLDHLVPGFRALVVASGYLDQLDPLYSRRGDQVLQTTANKLIGIAWFRCGVGCLVHASLLAVTV